MTGQHDDFEDRVGREIRAYVIKGVGDVDARAVVDKVRSRSVWPNRSIGALGAASAVIVALAIGAAVLIRNPSPPAASDEPSQTPRGTPIAVASPPTPASSVVAPSQSAAPGPTEDLSARERSDRYWEEQTHFGAYSFTYDSLAEITEDSHLVVVGRVINLRPGEIQSFEINPFHDGLPTIFGVVEIDEVLKGDALSQSPGTILVGDLGSTSTTFDDLPEGQVVFFLKNYAQLREDEGVSPSADENDKFYYSRPNGYQCVLRNLGGRVRMVDGPRGAEEAFGPFPWSLDGQSFDAVLERIRDIAALND